jgi:hypothetical protein
MASTTAIMAASSSSSSGSTEDEAERKLETPKRRETPDRAAKRKAVAASNKKAAASTAKKKRKISSNSKRKMPSSKGKKRTLETIQEEAVELLYKTTRSVPNYTVEEDVVLLCKAWVSCSTDETKGKDRKGTAFWNDVKEKFDQLAAQEDDDSVDYSGREAESLKSRFLKTIQKQVYHWNRYYKKSKEANPSGWNEEMHIKKSK